MRFFSDLDWNNWFYGLLAGGIGGGATSVTAGVIAGTLDNHFQLGTPKSISLIWETFVVSFLMSVALYLKQNPLPQHLKTVTTTVQTTEPIKPEGKVVTTVAETHTEELPKV